jgi:hypothetical protein
MNKGTKHSRSACQQVSDSLRKRWADPIFRTHMMRVRKEQATPKEKKRLKDALITNWENPKMRKKLIKHLQTFSKTKEQRENNSNRMKKLWQDPNYRAKQVKAIHNKKWRKKVAESNTRTKTGSIPWNKYDTKRTHPSLMAASLKLKGKLPKYNKFKCWYPSDDQRVIEMRSSWEVSFALWLDAGEIEWEYEPKYFHIGRGSWTGETYTPDFYLPDNKVYVELKGYMSKQNAAKMERFKDLYTDVNLYVFFEEHLEKVLQFREAA